MAGLGGLAGLGYLAGGIGQGMDDATQRRLKELQVKAAKESMSSGDDVGNALAASVGVKLAPQASVPGATQFGGGGMLGKLQSMFGGGQGGPPPQAGGMPPGGAPPQMSGPTGRTPPAMGAPPAAPPQMGAPQGGGMPPPQAGAPPPPRPQMGAPQPQGQPQAQGQGAPPPQVQAALQQMDYPTIIKALASQPGMTGGRLAAALDRITPYMNAQTQQQYKTAMLGIRQQGVDQQGTNIDSEVAARNALGPYRAAMLKQHQDTLDATNKRLDDADRARDRTSLQTALSEAQRSLNSVETQLSNEQQFLKTSDPDYDTRVAEFKTQIAQAHQRIQDLTTDLNKMPAAGGGDTPSSTAANTMKQLDQARAAIKDGVATKEQVIEILKQKGIDPAAL